MAAMKEQETVRAILQFLALHRIPAWRMNQGAMRGEHKGKRWFMKFGVTGMSDIIGVLPWCAEDRLRAEDPATHRVSCLTGRFLAIEVKQPRKAPSPAQVAFIQTVILSGGVAFVAHSVAEVKEKLCL